jgi:hypothetical protein
VHAHPDTRIWHAPKVFSWDTYRPASGGVTFGASGASTDRRRAMQNLGDALLDAPPGTRGVLWKVELDLIGTARYEYGGIIARAEHDPTSGSVTWSNCTPA